MCADALVGHSHRSPRWRGSGRGDGGGRPTPASLPFGAQWGALASQSLTEVGVAGVLIAPSQIGVQPPSEDGVTGMIGVVQYEIPGGAEMALDRIGPGGIGRCKAQLHVVRGAPPAEGRALMSRQGSVALVEGWRDEALPGLQAADIFKDPAIESFRNLAEWRQQTETVCGHFGLPRPSVPTNIHGERTMVNPLDGSWRRCYRERS
jgi:hypothetical protein